MSSKMSSECYFRTDVPITTLHGILKRHVIIYNPPYNIRGILSEYFCEEGPGEIKIVIEHSTRHVDMNPIDRHSVSTLVTRTMVDVFQTHRLQPPVSARGTAPYRIADSPLRPVPYRIADGPLRPAVGQQTGHSCCICMDPIFSDTLLVLPCAHLFHAACIERWVLETSLSPSCPVCRTPLT